MISEIFYIKHLTILDTDIDALQKEMDKELVNFTEKVLVTVPRMKAVTVPSMDNEETEATGYGPEVGIGLSLALIVCILLCFVCMRRCF